MRGPLKESRGAMTRYGHLTSCGHDYCGYLRSWMKEIFVQSRRTGPVRTEL
jgi:hypothetical protein